MMSILQSAAGLLVFVGIAWLLSENRRCVPWRTVLAGLGLQLALAVILVKLPLSRHLFLVANDIMLSLERATAAGTAFVFGYLGGAPLPFQESYVGTSFVLAFRALPLVLVISALSALLFYWRVLPAIVQGCSHVLQRTMGIGGAVGIGVAANVFVGMVEAPLFVRPYLKDTSRGELFMIMTCGMATIAGTVMVLYATILRDVIPDAMGHLLVASIISAPAAIIIAALMVPPEGGTTAGVVTPSQVAESSMDAITKGTLQGVQLLLNIVAMLIVLVALVSLLNQILGLLPALGGEAITLQRMLGYLLAPLVWLMGIPMNEALTAGALMGTKTVLNELIAYTELARLSPEALSERSRLILTYAMCGFANPGSLGIMVGGMGTMVPERRGDIVALGLKSIIAGTLATSMTGAVIGMFTA
jgi:CNT family concentrative nucleoside transporter